MICGPGNLASHEQEMPRDHGSAPGSSVHLRGALYLLFVSLACS